MSVPTASPLTSSAAPARGHQRDQCERRVRSVPTANATSAVSATNVEGLLPCSTACSTAPCCVRQMTTVIVAAPAPASPAAMAFLALRQSERSSTTSAMIDRTKQATPETTAAADDSQRGMYDIQLDTSSATSRLPAGRVLIEPTITTTTRNATIA